MKGALASHLSDMMMHDRIKPGGSFKKKVAAFPKAEAGKTIQKVLKPGMGKPAPSSDNAVTETARSAIIKAMGKK